MEPAWSCPEKAMDELEGQHLVDLVGVIPVTLQVALNYFLQSLSFNIWPARLRGSSNISRMYAASASRYQTRKWKTLCLPRNSARGEERKGMVDPGYPLRHSHVICILGFE